MARLAMRLYRRAEPSHTFQRTTLPFPTLEVLVIFQRAILPFRKAELGLTTRPVMWLCHGAEWAVAIPDTRMTTMTMTWTVLRRAIASAAWGVEGAVETVVASASIFFFPRPFSG